MGTAGGTGGSGKEPKRTFRLSRHPRDEARRAVDEELAFHLEMVEEELRAEGWTAEAAHTEARRSFGELDETRTRCVESQTRLRQEAKRTMSRQDLAQDLKQALRSVRSAPGYAALVVGTLAFAIAANTIVFSAMNPYLLRPLPYGHPDRLVQVNVVNPVTGWDMDRVSYPEYLDWKARTKGFTGLAAYRYGAVTVTDTEAPERIQLAFLSPNMFDVLEVPPALGRGFTAAEARPGGPAVVVLSDRLWRTRFHADLGVLGKTLTMDGVKHTVVGVMPPSFNFPFGTARMWVPIQADASSSRTYNNFMLVGRLAPGWTSTRARAELGGIQHELAALHPDTDGRMSGVTITPLRQALNFAWDVLSIGFRVLLGGVFFVLLIACVNVASLTLARGGARSRELAVRASLGAGRGRIVRQLLAESLLLALMSGVLGVALSWWVAGLLRPILPEDLFRVGRIDIDGTVLLFSLAVTLLTPVAFGLLPALRASRVDLSGALKGSPGGGPRLSRGRSALVVAQVALAVILVSGAGLMLRSLSAVRAMDLGFDARRVVVAEVLLPSNAFPHAAERTQYLDRAVAAMQRVSGVSAASASQWIPMNHELFPTQAATPRTASRPPDKWPVTAVNRVRPGYFDAMGIAVLEGRDLSAVDETDASDVAVVSRSLARKMWPGEDAVGQTLLEGNDPTHPRTLTVVGVVADARANDLDQDEVTDQIYLPIDPGALRRYFLLARTDGAPSAQVPALRKALLGAEPDVPVSLRPMTDVLREDQLQWSMSSAFLGGFGLGAILLATLGIYGLIAYSVGQRRKEMGVRLALGATRAEIRRRIMGHGVRLAAIGVVIGLAGSLALGRVVGSLLYGVSPFDPVTLGVVLTLFLTVAALASLLPAERASRTDPVAALRSE